MKKFFPVILFFCCMLNTTHSSAQEKYSKVKIPVTSPAIKKFALDNLELDHYGYDGNAMVVVLNTTEMNRLRNSHYPFEVLVDDVVAHTIEVNSHPANRQIQTSTNVALQAQCQQVTTIIQTPASFGTGGSLRLGAGSGPGYFTYAEMVTKMQALVSAYPGLAKLDTIGYSSNGNVLYCIKISDNVATDEAEPEVLYTGLQHAREAIAGTSLIFYMQYLLENYATDTRIKELVDNRELYILPCMNPDGYIYNYTSPNPTSGGGLWRKNRRLTGGAGNIGVDLNRNYNSDWSNCAGASTSCGSNVKTDETYYGPSAFSEPETQAIRDFVETRHFVNSVDQHCYGPYCTLPYGRPSLHPVMNHIDSMWYVAIPAVMGLYSGHRAGNNSETVNYDVAGGNKDWMLLGDIGVGTKGKIYGFTSEAGGGDFWAPVSQIVELCKGLCFQDLQLAYNAGDYFDIQDLKDISLPSSTTGKLSFKLLRIGQAADPVTVSIVPIENIQSVGTSITTTLTNFYDTYTDSISYTLPTGMTAGQSIKFAWKVTSGGITTYDTITKFYNPVVLLSDDMEGTFATNWNTTSDVADKWAYTTLSAFGGTHSMTESPAGNYTTSTTRTATYKNSFVFTDATAAYLTFWSRHHAENMRDKLQVQVSLNNSTWVPVCGNNTVQENNTVSQSAMNGEPGLTGIRDNWTKEVYDLSAYKANPNVYLRLQFTSDADPGGYLFEKQDGFYIDNLKVIKSTTTLFVLPIQFVNFYAKLLNNNSVALNWEATTTNQHDYFEVEKYTDYNAASVIATVATAPPYKAFDYAPQQGNNYYRIKEVNKNGKVIYSNVININYMPGKSSVVMYPNPAKDFLNIKINSSKADNIVVQISDAEGRKVYEQSAKIKIDESELKINIKSLSSQLYFLKITNSNNESIYFNKFLKQ